MNEDLVFETILNKYEPLIRGQLKKLNIYKNYDEFYHVGVIGLWEAYKKYDEKKGEFSTFAYFYVRGRMLSFLKQESQYDGRHFFVEQIAETATVLSESPPFIDDLLKKHLTTLTAREKLWIEEAMILGKKTAEIASDYDVSISTVKSWRRLAIKKLKTTELREELFW